MKLVRGIFLLVLLSSFAAAGCGGGGVRGDAVGPIISEIQGDGSAPNQFQSSLIVKGENFTNDMEVSLGSLANDSSFSLTYSFDSPSQLTANLPGSLTDGEYQLTITAAAGSATTPVTILQGEPGPAGADGITIKAQFTCGPSGDLDPTADNRTGQSTNVTRFSDGSFSISCMADFLNGTFLYVDTSSYSEFFASNSTGVAGGLIGCVPFYVTSLYSIPDNAVTYVNQADTSQTQTVACVQTYP